MAATQPASDLAIDAPGVCEWLRRLRRQSSVLLALAVVALAGFVVAADRIEHDPSSTTDAGIEVPPDPPAWIELAMIGSFVGGLLALGIGGAMAVRGRRVRRLLESGPWEAGGARAARFGTARVGRWLVGVPGPTGWTVWAVTSSLRRTLARSGVSMLELLDLAGGRGRYVVVRAAGSDVLLLARRPRSTTTVLRWQGSFPTLYPSRADSGP